jgi:hypothetical protein
MLDNVKTKIHDNLWLLKELYGKFHGPCVEYISVESLFEGCFWLNLSTLNLPKLRLTRFPIFIISNFKSFFSHEYNCVFVLLIIIFLLLKKTHCVLKIIYEYYEFNGFDLPIPQ